MTNRGVVKTHSMNQEELYQKAKEAVANGELPPPGFVFGAVMSYAEIGKELGISAAEAKAEGKRALAKLGLVEIT